MATYMFEVYYAAPVNHDKEARISNCAASFAGRLDCREESYSEYQNNICLTYEFDSFERAELAAQELRQHGEHVEGICLYGN